VAEASIMTFLAALARPRDAFANLGPNWFASVMGTGIVANAAATLPVAVPGQRAAATLVWLLAASMLVGLSVAWAVHWARFRDVARGHAADPVMAQFWGAPPMALMTVGSGALLLGRDWIGLAAAVRLDAALWLAGTVLGLVTAAWIPYAMMSRPRGGAPFAGWLMPVVPPMVSASTGAPLVAYAPAGLRVDFAYALVAMFGMSLFATLVLLPQIWSRLVSEPLPARLVPTVWIVLGPLGQSVTAAGAVSAVFGHPGLGVLYGVPVFGFGLLWLVIAIAVTRAALRSGMPFALTWWSFTFPVGTMVTGASSLAGHTGASLFSILAVGLYALLATAWAVVASRTARGCYSGALLR
jgi:C4-dicarboxylate transporter/malic acid transport protein